MFPLSFKLTYYSTLILFIVMITTGLVAATVADLNNVTFQNGHGLVLLGDVVMGDIDPKFYKFDASSSAVADGNLVIRPSMYASTNGRLLRASWDQYYNDLRFKPIGYVPSWTDVTGKPTTLTGYGITDGVSSTRTLAINSSSYDLSANRSWTIDKASVGLGNVDNTSDASKPISTANQTALNTKQANITLTTTGSGVATFLGNVLNIPTPATNTYTSGTGISIASNIITNTAPYIAPTITTPTMVLGTSYQAPANKNVWVNASITHTIALTLVLSSGSSLVQLQTSPNNSTWTTINSAGFSDAVAIAVALTKTVTNNVSGEVPQGYYYRLLATTSGAGTAAITNQQLKTY